MLVRHSHLAHSAQCIFAVCLFTCCSAARALSPGQAAHRLQPVLASSAGEHKLPAQWTLVFLKDEVTSSRGAGTGCFSGLQRSLVTLPRPAARAGRRAPRGRAQRAAHAGAAAGGRARRARLAGGWLLAAPGRSLGGLARPHCRAAAGAAAARHPGLEQPHRPPLLRVASSAQKASCLA